MEEKIIEILKKIDELYSNKRYELPEKRQKIAAKEIASLCYEKEFVRWKDLYTICDRFPKSELLYLITDMKCTLSWITLDELYEYWKREVRK